jgi:hypothetical protein
MNQLTLHIYNITLSLITIKCDNTITIKKLKELIAKLISNDCEHYDFSLIYNNIELDDNVFCNTV